MKIIIGVGVPGCGKTTYLKPLAKDVGMEYINPDDIREKLTGDSTDHTKEVQVWEEVHSRVIISLRGAGAVVDATYAKLKDRRQLIELCKRNGANEVIVYWFNTPLKVCIERNAKRERIVPESVVMKMHNRLRLNPPTKEEGFTEVIEIK